MAKKKCPKCKGKGKTGGWPQGLITCPKCGGTGKARG